MNEKQTYTQGPWFLEGNFDPTTGRQLGGWVSCFPPGGAPLFEISPVTGSKEEICANAHLLAAAPELLEALQEAIEWDSHDDHDVPAVWLDVARAAVSKAKGNN